MVANRIKTFLEREENNPGQNALIGLAQDLEIMKQRLAKLQSRGGLYASIGFGDEVVNLIERLEATTVTS